MWYVAETSWNDDELAVDGNIIASCASEADAEDLAGKLNKSSVRRNKPVRFAAIRR